MKEIDCFKFEKKLASKTVNQIFLSNVQLNRKYIQSIPNETFDIIENIIKSDYLQMEFRKIQYKTHIKPQMLKITNQTGQDCTFSYVSPLDLCNLLLQNQYLVSHLVEEASSVSNENTTFSSIMDSANGARLKGKLKIEFYIDDSLLSPTGHNQSQKCIFIYASFPDIPFKFRSKSNQIEMILMINRHELKKLNLADTTFSLFKQLRRDMRHLIENGINVQTSNGIKNIPVTISSICGDNLGIFEILGFRRSFLNTAFVCRFCGATGYFRHIVFKL